MTVSAEWIITVCCEHFGRTREELMSKSHVASIARARHVAMFLVNEITGRSHSWIAQRFAGRHNTTVLGAIRKITAMEASDPAMKAELEVLRAKIAKSMATMDGGTSALSIRVPAGSKG